MELLIERCAGLDVHKASVTATVRILSMRGWDMIGTWSTGQWRSRADCCGYLNSGADLGQRSGPAVLEESAVLSLR